MNFTVEIASVPDRDEVVAEIWWGDAMVAELHRNTGGEVQIEIYPRESGSSWEFDLSSWIATLTEARRKLV
jgi:hypothetical protein